MYFKGYFVFTSWIFIIDEMPERELIYLAEIKPLDLFPYDRNIKNALFFKDFTYLFVKGHFFKIKYFRKFKNDF